eukprot:GSChrysophyteH2.ASY1.ANO1.1292.1 assembled CDS
MLASAAHRLGASVVCLDPAGSRSPCGQVCHLAVEGALHDAAAFADLGAVSDVVTVELEHVNCKALAALEIAGACVQPSSSTISMIQDKFLQKEYLSSQGIPVAKQLQVDSLSEAHAVGSKLGYPFMLKKRRAAYDGRGNTIVLNPSDVHAAWMRLRGGELYAEQWVDFSKELAVITEAEADDSIVCFPVVETLQQNSICRAVLAPAPIDSSSAKEAEAQAVRAVQAFPDGCGVFGVELYLLPDGSVIFNEIAPRPHNSGHYTIDACDIDQFEMHVRCILGMPLVEPQMLCAAAVMVNVLGRASMKETRSLIDASLGISGAKSHWYGKTENRPGRKMGHITLLCPFNSTNNALDPLCKKTQQLLANEPKPEQEAILGITARVALVVETDSDLRVMNEAVALLESIHFKVACDTAIISAHSTPAHLYQFAQSASDRGIKVIIAAAGGAAHLPGMIASMTALPVIGVPLSTTALKGQDALLSMVQMPQGAPVATVSIGGVTNAALLALRILGVSDSEIQTQMAAYLAAQEARVLDSADRLRIMGTSAYLQATAAAGAGEKGI